MIIGVCVWVFICGRMQKKNSRALKRGKSHHKIVLQHFIAYIVGIITVFTSSNHTKKKTFSNFDMLNKWFSLYERQRNLFMIFALNLSHGIDRNQREKEKKWFKWWTASFFPIAMIIWFECVVDSHYVWMNKYFRYLIYGARQISVYVFAKIYQ